MRKFFRNFREAIDKSKYVSQNVQNYFIFKQLKIKLKSELYGETRTLSTRMLCCIFWVIFQIHSMEKLILLCCLDSIYQMRLGHNLQKRHQQTTPIMLILEIANNLKFFYLPNLERKKY